MTNEEIVQNSDKAVTECTKVVSATHPIIKSPGKHTNTSHKGNPKNPNTPPQVKPKKTFETVVTSPSKYNKSSAMVVPSAPPQRYRPYDLMQQPRRTVNFLSQMEARCMIPIQVRRENPPSNETLSEWASSLQLGNGKTKPLDLKLRLRLL
ncbi:hypothetical protein DEO72_LG6g2253 [Vigna unguiculata]|uniref:Uncharacterized protein n=1 Tax=Vigna unguiculata TaxID=3917 RepID=A0A4D6M9P0_VIGUN|nr:hypothetical protein DEO72_LG6g2253 [Vigna unguiculata]